ncbi:MAG: hypothetical protein ACI85F_000276 [Bacteroidia bacterium]|jgi:hypothetical protein
MKKTLLTGALAIAFMGGTIAQTITSAYFTVSDHTNFMGANDDECNCDHSATRLTTSAVDLSAATTVIAKMDMYYWDVLYGGAQEVATFEFSIDGGTTWTVVDNFVANAETEVWQDGLLLDASAAAGNASVMFSWLYSDATGWEYGIATDNFLLFEPAPTDVEMSSLNIPAVTGSGMIDIAGTITNLGSTTLDDVTITWTDGGADNDDNLTGLGLGFGDSYNFTHATQLTGVGGNTYNLTVTATAAGDGNNSNDALMTSVDVVDQVATRLTMVEDFTSSTCPPCFSLSVNLFDGSGMNAGLDAMNGNAQSGAQVSVVKYPVDWPGDGDHGWNSEVEARRAYYGVTGAPTPFADGVDYNFSTFNSGDVANHQDDVSFHDISATHSISGTNITVNVTVDPYASESATLHIALVEKEYDATGASSFSNGETEFHHIMRKMLPNAGGTSVSLVSGNQYTTSESYSATVQPINDFDLTQSAGTFAFHTDAEVEVVAWLQAADQTILNSTVSVGDTEWETGGGAGVEDFADNTSIGVYPNPVTDDQLNVVVSSEQATDAVVTVTDMRGAIVLSENMGSIAPGTNKMTLNIVSLASGLYNVNVISNGHISSTKVTVK